MSEGKDTVHYLQAAVETKDAWVRDRALRRAFDDLKTAEDETQKLRQQLSEAGIRISGFIAEREMAKSEVDRLRGRCSELESEIEFITGLGSKLTQAATLRKQAEAVEGCVSEMDCNGPLKYRKVAFDYAQRLRQQAVDLEKSND